MQSNNLVLKDKDREIDDDEIRYEQTNSLVIASIIILLISNQFLVTILMIGFLIHFMAVWPANSGGKVVPGAGSIL